VNNLSQPFGTRRVPSVQVSTALRGRPSALLSVVIPCYNEHEVLPLMYERLNAVLNGLDLQAEVILVDDGSSDNTADIMRGFTEADPRYRALMLSRNYGHQIALTAGLDYAAGDVVAVLDADLQDPPEVLREMIAKWREGFDVVYGQRTLRHGETWMKKATASLFYRLIKVLSGVDVPENVGDFRLMDRAVVDAVNRMPERFRFVRGLVVWAGFRQCAVRYERDPRAKGVTKYPWRRMLRFALDAIFSFSVVPLRLAFYTGMLVMAGAMALIARILYLRFLTDSVIPGFTAIYVVVLFFGGLNLIVLGIVGEYIGRMYVEIKGRPLYFVSALFGEKALEERNVSAQNQG
jgi:polyisoprenyl-phosphate glycosyltransferase